MAVTRGSDIFAYCRSILGSCLFIRRLHYFLLELVYSCIEFHSLISRVSLQEDFFLFESGSPNWRFLEKFDCFLSQSQLRFLLLFFLIFISNVLIVFDLGLHCLSTIVTLRQSLLLGNEEVRYNVSIRGRLTQIIRISWNFTFTVP